MLIIVAARIQNTCSVMVLAKLFYGFHGSMESTVRTRPTDQTVVGQSFAFNRWHVILSKIILDEKYMILVLLSRPCSTVENGSSVFFLKKYTTTCTSAEVSSINRKEKSSMEFESFSSIWIFFLELASQLSS